MTAGWCANRLFTSNLVSLRQNWLLLSEHGLNYIHPILGGTPGAIEPDNSVAGCNALCRTFFPICWGCFPWEGQIWWYRLRWVLPWAHNRPPGMQCKGGGIAGRGGSPAKVAEVQFGRDYQFFRLLKSPIFNSTLHPAKRPLSQTSLQVVWSCDLSSCQWVISRSVMWNF